MPRLGRDYWHAEVLDETGWQAALRPILRNWIKLQREYLRQWQGSDLPYWYNERANVGLLAAAAWKAGHAALEEFTATKGARDAAEGEAGKRLGRGDLSLRIKKESVLVEAKIVWPMVDWTKGVDPQPDPSVFKERASKWLGVPRTEALSPIERVAQ